MGSRLGSGLLGRRRRPSMDSHPVDHCTSVSCSNVLFIPLPAIVWSRVLLQGGATWACGSGGALGLLTGPIIVACQWNCIARRQYMSNIAISLNNHKDGVIALTSARSQWVVSWG
jgi:hypothetical protein